MRLGLILLLALLATAFAAEESCMDRCENGFNSQKKCQCDSMCRYYKSCCSDYETTCRMRTRGDTFVLAEDDDKVLFDSTPTPVTVTAHATTADSSRRQQRPDHSRNIASATGTTKVPTTEKAPLTLNVPPTQKVPTEEDVLTSTPKGPTTTEKVPLKPNVHTTRKVPTEGHALTPTLTTEEPITTPVTPTEEVVTTTEAPDPDAVVCSGRPFDSFTQLKNGSIYAFRGDYFFVLDEKSVLPGYPKLIQDVWGIRGPIDAAFTRINCQGKTYIFKRNQYWRFDDGVLDDDYPRDITVGFDKIPDNVDGAFAIPAHSHHGKERVYFFKGDQYYQYQFLHQPTHEECIGMLERSPSTLFRRYTDVYYNNWEQFYNVLFGDMPIRHSGHHFIDKDWVGIKSPVNAVMGGRIYVAPWSPPPPPPPNYNDGRGNYRPDQHWGQQWGQQFGQQQQWGRHRQSRSSFWESMAERGMDMGQGFAERGMEMGQRMAERGMEMRERGMELDQRMVERGLEMRERLEGMSGRRQDQDRDRDRQRDDHQRQYGSDSRYYSPADVAYWDLVRKGQPLQSVYFFKGEKYYRVDLKTKKVDFASPPYPRSIAKYWLGCNEKTKAEKK